ncbi:MAG: hypothetical protein KDB14_27480 [Planctomycetales bacterium]|nr:hypothetical protein [Planctomycetales bacterium]
MADGVSVGLRLGDAGLASVFRLRLSQIPFSAEKMA